jgi:hypothetical protein
VPTVEDTVVPSHYHRLTLATLLCLYSLPETSLFDGDINAIGFCSSYASASKGPVGSLYKEHGFQKDVHLQGKKTHWPYRKTYYRIRTQFGTQKCGARTVEAVDAARNFLRKFSAVDVKRVCANSLF